MSYAGSGHGKSPLEPPRYEMQSNPVMGSVLYRDQMEPFDHFVSDMSEAIDAVTLEKPINTHVAEKVASITTKVPAVHRDLEDLVQHVNKVNEEYDERLSEVESKLGSRPAIDKCQLLKFGLSLSALQRTCKSLTGRFYSLRNCPQICNTEHSRKRSKKLVIASER